MGNFESGRPQIRQRVENTPRLDALDYSRANGLSTVARQMPEGAAFELGTCPVCARACRDLFAVESVVKCRECHDLIYTRDSQHNSHAAAVAADPASASGEALEAIQTYVETGEPAKYNQCMKTLCALDRLPTATAATHALTEELNDRILADDLNTMSALVEIIKSQIVEGMENTTTRRGEPLEIAMRGETLAKLTRALVMAANFRSMRANQMLDLIAARATPEERESLRDGLREAMRAEGYTMPSGHTLDELHAAQRGEKSGDDGAVE